MIAERGYRDRLALDERWRKEKRVAVRMAAGAHPGPIEQFPEWVHIERYAPLPPDVLGGRNRFNRQSLETIRKAAAAGDLGLVLPIAKLSTQALGLNVDWQSDEGAETLHACANALARAFEAITAKRDAGQVVETPTASTLPQDLQDAPEAAQSPSDSPTPAYRFMRDLVPLWKSKTKGIPGLRCGPSSRRGNQAVPCPAPQRRQECRLSVRSSRSPVPEQGWRYTTTGDLPRLSPWVPENAGVSTVRIHRLLGHADGSVDARYTHLDVAVMAEDVGKVAFPFLDLPRVYPTRD